jgi:hypothetical protein
MYVRWPAFPDEASAPEGLTQALGVKPHATYCTGALGDLLAAEPRLLAL